MYTSEESAAAVQIQSRFRGRQVQKSLTAIRERFRQAQVADAMAQMFMRPSEQSPREGDDSADYSLIQPEGWVPHDRSFEDDVSRTILVASFGFQTSERRAAVRNRASCRRSCQHSRSRRASRGSSQRSRRGATGSSRPSLARWLSALGRCSSARHHGGSRA